MDKNFSAVINEIMPLVRDGDNSVPFVISRNKAGSWNVQYPYPADSVGSLLSVRKKHDPYAVSFCGADFSKGGFSSVYDKLLCSRLYAEFNKNRMSGEYQGHDDIKEVRAVYDFFEANIGEFSQKLTDYLTTVDKPLAELAEMCPYRMATDNDDCSFNEDLAFDAVHYIENEVGVRLRANLTERGPEKRCIDGYEEKQSVRIGQVSIVFAENLSAFSPYLVCNRENGEDYSRSAFPSYVSAMREFTARQATLVNALESERKSRSGRGVDEAVLTSEHCLPESAVADFTGKPIVVKAGELSPEFRYSDSQLILCTHGSGARPGKYDRTVFGTELYSGDTVCYGRHQIEGVADESKLPQWAKTKFEIMRDKEIFEYGGYHFKPVRRFRDGELDKPQENDSRPRKQDARYAMRNMSSDFSLGITSYDRKKTDDAYSADAFYAASGDSTADIFKCIENGRLYVPGENELFRYKEPPQNEKPAPSLAKPQKEEPPTLLDELSDAKEEAAARNAAPKDKPQTKKRGEAEI
jgi:hypothetical protein